MSDHRPANVRLGHSLIEQPRSAVVAARLAVGLEHRLDRLRRISLELAVDELEAIGRLSDVIASGAAQGDVISRFLGGALGLHRGDRRQHRQVKTAVGAGEIERALFGQVHDDAGARAALAQVE